MITQSINLNLIPGAVPPRIKVSQYDFGSRTLQFTLFNGTSPFTTASLTARIQGTKPDNKGFSYDATYSAGVVTADVTRQMTACAGAVTCELVIVDGSNNELGTGNFILDVEAAALSEDTDISDTEIPAIIDAAETNAERAEDAADRAEAASANPPYIGENEHWYVWDISTEQYVDSGVDAEGVDGVGIVSIAKTGTVGLVDTYTITLSNGNMSTFTVTNGAEATLPSGGMAGQALIKNSSTASDASWKDISTTGAIKWTQAEGYVGKNKLIYPYVDTTKSANGVEFTDKGNGSVGVKITNSATARTVFFFKNAGSAFSPKAGSYKLYSGSNNANITVAIDAYNGVTWVKSIIATDGTFVLDYNGYDRITVFLAVANGTTAADITITPMIYDAGIGDPAYAPYVPSNAELANSVDGITAGEIVPDTYDTTQNLISSAISSLYASGKIKIGCPYISSVLKTGSSRWGMIVIGLTSTECTGLLWKYTDLFTFNYINGSVSVKKATLSDL